METTMAYTVLIVDDSRDETEITKRVLTKAGTPLKVVSVARGEEALALLKGTDSLPSLILLDLKMPGMNGVETLRRIRADDRLKRVPVAIVTNSSLEADRNESFAAGADNFLNKSIDMDQYGREIKLLLEKWLKA
jgi:two-component system response regulator